MALSAADLQKRHELEGAPDPFPSLSQATPAKPRTPSTLPVNTESEEAFPTLASATPATNGAAKPVWGSATGPRIKSTAIKTPVFTDSFTLSAIDLSNSGKDGKPATLGEVIKQVIAKYKVKVEASTNQKTRQTTFHVKAESQKELDKAKRSLLALLSPLCTNGNGHANGNGKASYDDDDEEPTIPVTLVGPQPLAYEAQALLNQIISSKTSKATQRVRDIPAHILPFIVVRRTLFLSAAQDGTVNLALNSTAREITASGDREAVVRVVESIKQTIEGFQSSLTSVKISLPKRQHRLLTGQNADTVMSKSNCAVIVGKAEEQGDEVTVWGQSSDLPAGLSAQLATYLNRIQYGKTLKATHPTVDVYLPSPDAAADVDAVVKQFSDLIGRLIGGTRDVSVDWLLHRVITGKNGKKLKQFHEVHNVHVYFPNESLESSNILLKKKHLDEVEKEILKWARDAADRWHDAVVGNGGTTLNAIIGEDTTLSIKVGAEAGDASTEDVILVRGVSDDVDHREDAKNDEIVNSHSTEFDIDKEYVGRIVGSQGAGVNKLRDQLGVKVDVSDDVDEKEKEGGKKKKAVHVKSRVKITGRKENVEEAEKRILAQIERLADETSEILKIPAQYHSSLIGQSGKYAIRLEEKYSVKITFPRQSSETGEGKTREQLKSDEVLVKGGKKGVAGAKSELLEAAEFEKESNNILKFTVPTRSVARILGRGGASINEIKDSTDAQIDIEKGSEENGTTTSITVRGTKKAIAAAKAAILVISDQVMEGTTASVAVDSKFHRTIIGAGGQGLKDLVARCGGPSDPKLQAGLIRFPRQGERSDDVRIRGEPKLVAKLKTELEQIVATLRDRVILALDIPAAQHRALIGRGGQHLNDVQDKFKVQIQFPGSRSYNQVGEPENLAELGEVDPANIVKVSGPRAACEKAIAELKSNIKAPAAEAVTSTISVPLKYHHAISQQGTFFRTLRSFGVQVDHSAQPQKSAVPTRPTPSARIDDTSTDSSEPEWEIVSNYQDAEEGDSIWTLRARDQAGLERAEGLVKEAIENAGRMSHVGFLTMADRSTFPRIVGAKGSNVARLRNETGADITVSRENNTIVIIGAESEILAAKDAILRMVSNPGRSRRHD
ncbi:SCP160 protein [Flammula alnicola]|nr:SCP160 protein [Flammula alnicola]